MEFDLTLAVVRERILSNDRVNAITTEDRKGCS